MASEEFDLDQEVGAPSWRRAWAGVGAVLATVLLVGLVVMVTFSNRARDQALAWERHTYDVMLLTRTVDTTMARSESTLARFVLDENPQTGRIYYSQWRQAGYQIAQLRRLLRDDPEQLQRIERLRDLYQQRGAEFAAAASSAVAKQESGGVPLFYQAGLSKTGPALSETLKAIADAERNKLRERMAETRRFDALSEKLTSWLGWFGLLIGLGAIVLGLVAYWLITERVIARKEAYSEANRAAALERAVAERTRELRDANDLLRDEAAERAAAEAQLRQVQKMEAVGQLTGGIAHDFNNMLAVVVGGLDLARRKLRGPKREVEFHLDNAMEGASRAAALTRRLLAFSRNEALMPQALAANDLVSGMFELIDRSLGERITVRTRFPEESWHIWADSSQLENAILNLCVNARDAMDGEGEVGVAVENVTLDARQGELDPGEYVRVAITDTGSGIPPEILDRVFEPFFTTKPVGKGTGLGLSQIFGFARQSGGDVAIQSTVDVGTTVSIYLPRTSRVPDALSAGALQGGGDEILSGREEATILVVEDDPRVSRSTVAALDELGYHPIACSGGREALDMLQAMPEIELVVTDVMMPEMTGPELVRAVAERYPQVAVLFVTGFAGDAIDPEELAGHAVLRKPFTVAALAEAVAKAFSRKISESLSASASAAAE